MIPGVVVDISKHYDPGYLIDESYFAFESYIYYEKKDQQGLVEVPPMAYVRDSSDRGLDGEYTFSLGAVEGPVNITHITVRFSFQRDQNGKSEQSFRTIAVNSGPTKPVVTVILGDALFDSGPIFRELNRRRQNVISDLKEM